MENASKALLIAGGIFLALLIVSVMMYMSNSITEIGEAQENRRAAEQLAAFNAEYEAYNKKLMYGTDIITVINKAKEDKVNIKIGNTVITETTSLDNTIKNNIYACKEIKYDNVTGKVTSMAFEKRDV